MSEAFTEIEKLCLQALHDGNIFVCYFEKKGRKYVSDSYAVWAFPKDYETGESYVKYPKNEGMVEKLYGIIEKYRKIETVFPLESSFESVLTRGYTATKYVSWYSGYEVWLQDKYVSLFRSFKPEFCVYPEWEDLKPIIVRHGEEMIGLIMPLHVTEEVRAKKEQETLL